MIIIIIYIVLFFLSICIIGGAQMHWRTHSSRHGGAEPHACMQAGWHRRWQACRQAACTPKPPFVIGHIIDIFITIIIVNGHYYYYRYDYYYYIIIITTTIVYYYCRYYIILLLLLLFY